MRILSAGLCSRNAGCRRQLTLASGRLEKLTVCHLAGFHGYEPLGSLDHSLAMVKIVPSPNDSPLKDFPRFFQVLGHIC